MSAVRKALGLVSGLLVAWCGHAMAAGECPDWTRGKPPSSYPQDKFLVGMGVVAGVYDAARGEPRGRDAAQADIARQLLSRVESQTDIAEEGSNHGPSSLSVRQRESITTSLVGPGARAVDRCFDWKNTTFYLLAVLDRNEAAARVKVEIAAANRHGAGELGAAEAALAAGNPLAAVAPLGRALAAHDQIESQSAVLRALAAVEAPEPFASGARLAEVEDGIRRRTRVLLAVDDPELRARLSEQLTSRHIESTTVASEALIQVSATVETVRLERSAALGQFVAQVRTTVQIKRADTGAVVGTASREGKNGGPTEDVARRRAAAEAAKALVPEIDRLLVPLAPPARTAPGGVPAVNSMATGAGSHRKP